MSKKCSKFDQCPIAKYFVEEGWQLMLDRYCHGEFFNCGCLVLIQEDRPVPLHMMPWDRSKEFAPNRPSLVPQ